MTADRWINLLILIPVLLFCLMMHELAHGFVAYRLGDPTAKRAGRLSFNPIRHLDPLGAAMFIITYVSSGWMFGWAKPVPVAPYYFKNRQRGMAIVGLAGPVTNFILAIIFALLLRWLHPSPTGRLADVLSLGFQLNVVLGIFNLVPIPPLDGSRVVGAFLPRNAYEKWVQVDRYGFVLVIAFLLLFRAQYGSLLIWVMNGLLGVFTNYYM
jgi:Zn-dependent protease